MENSDNYVDNQSTYEESQEHARQALRRFDDRSIDLEHPPLAGQLYNPNFFGPVLRSNVLLKLVDPHTAGNSDNVDHEFQILEPDGESRAGKKSAKQVLDPGTVCFWVEGRSLALPFGAMPVSKGNECRLVARVNILGKIEGDAKKLKSVQAGDRLRLESAA